MLLPEPYAKIKEISLGNGFPLDSGTSLVIYSNKTARVIQGKRDKARVGYIGSPVTVEPNRLNYFFLTGSSSGTGTYNPSTQYTAQLKVTPRYLLAGG